MLKGMSGLLSTQSSSPWILQIIKQIKKPDHEKEWFSCTLLYFEIYIFQFSKVFISWESDNKKTACYFPYKFAYYTNGHPNWCFWQLSFSYFDTFLMLTNYNIFNIPSKSRVPLPSPSTSSMILARSSSVNFLQK